MQFAQNCLIHNCVTFKRKERHLILFRYGRVYCAQFIHPWFRVWAKSRNFHGIWNKDLLVSGTTRDQTSKPKCGISRELKNFTSVRPCNFILHILINPTKSSISENLRKILRYIHLVRNLFYLGSNVVSILGVDNTSPGKRIKHEPYKGALFNAKLNKYKQISMKNHSKFKPSWLKRSIM